LKLNASLLRNKSDEQKERLKESFTAAKTLLNTLADKLEDKLEDAVTEAESKSNYADKDWPLFQADNFGYRRALRDILKLYTENK